MGLYAFRRLRAQEATAAAAADSVNEVVAMRKDSPTRPATFDEPTNPKPARKGRRSVATTAEN